LPRITILTHPDDVREHTVASLAILGPTYLDNGDYVIEVRNEAGFERRTVNVQFQTEEEYNEKFYRRYMAHKENYRLHEYGPGEERWEDLIPEVREFHRYVPEEEKPKVSASGKIRKRRKKHRYVMKKVMMPWGEEKDQEVTDEDASSESYSGSEDEGGDEKEQEEEEEDDWLQGPPSEGEEEAATEEPAAVIEESQQEVLTEEAPISEEPPVEEDIFGTSEEAPKELRSPFRRR
jgi:hypothetical protein